jgi:hypothetical protein
LESNRYYNLLIQSEKDGYLFINGSLRRKLVGGVWQVLNMDSMFRQSRQPQIFVTLYGEPGIGGKQMLIGNPKPVGRPAIVTLPDDNLSVRPVLRSLAADFPGLGLLFLLANAALLIAANRRAFGRFFDVNDLFTLRVRDEAFLINKPFSSLSLLFVLHLSFLVAYLLLLAQSQNIDLFGLRALLPAELDLPKIILAFLGLSAGIFGLLMGKFFLLFAFGQLYRADDVPNVHFFKILQASLLFFTTLVLLSAVLTNVGGLAWVGTSALVLLGLFYAARLVLLYLTIRSLSRLKNLYLISYLCLVELIPLIVGLRFAH